MPDPEQCEARLVLENSYGDETIIRCGRKEGHEGSHLHMFTKDEGSDKPNIVTIRWTKDERDPCRHGVYPAYDCDKVCANCGYDCSHHFPEEEVAKGAPVLSPHLGHKCPGWEENLIELLNDELFRDTYPKLSDEEIRRELRRHGRFDQVDIRTIQAFYHTLSYEKTILRPGTCTDQRDVQMRVRRALETLPEGSQLREALDMAFSRIQVGDTMRRFRVGERP